MFKVIELTDSEDEAVPEKKAKLAPPEKKTAAQHLTEVLESKAAANASATTHNIYQKSKSLPTTPVKATTTTDSSVATLLAPSSTVTNPLEISNSSSSSSSPTTKPGRQRSRKAQHQTMRLSPDMQFETITLDDEDQIQPTIPTLPPVVASTATTSTSTVASSTPQQIFAIPGNQISSSSSTNPRPIKHKLPMDKNSRDTLVKKVAEVFISRPDTSTVIRQIAEERIRINYLLAVFNMQEMSFTVNSHIEMLRFQLRDRLKQRRQQIMNDELEQQVRDKQIRQLQMEQELLMQQDRTEDFNEQDDLLPAEVEQ